MALVMVELGSTLKLQRAYAHLQDVESCAAKFLARKPYDIAPDDETYPGKRAFWITLNELPSDTISLATGDAIHNARAALDHIVYELSALMEPDPEDTGFPLIHTPKDWDRRKRNGGLNKGSGKHKTRLSGQAQAVIKRLQPMNGLDLTKIDRDTITRRKLVDLHNLDILDKHKKLNVAVAHVEVTPIAWYGDEAFPGFDHVFTGSLDLDTRTELVRLKGIPKVDVQSIPQIHVTLSEGGAGNPPIADHLRNLFMGVGIVLSELQQFLQP